MKQLLAVLILTTASAAKPNNAISHYMQDVGLLYLESAESLTRDCGQTSTADSDCLDQWHTQMDGLEDRITIHMDKTRANTLYFDMLKTARWMRENWAVGDSEQEREWAHKYAKCYAHLHTVALEGELLDSDGACEP